MREYVYDFLDFVRRSPTAFHAVDSICQMLTSYGFQILNESEPWTILQGEKYVVTRNRSSLIAFQVPADPPSHFQIVSSHGDSPTFKLKSNAEDVVCGKYVRLNTERYGGVLMSSWFDRPLSIAGRVLVRRGTNLETKLVNLDRDAILIPNMPIHFNREVNDGYKYNPQVDLLPLYGDGTSQGKLLQEIAAAADAAPEDILGSDLFLYNRTPGSVWGADNAYFSCPRIDDLECAYASVQAFVQSEAVHQINVCAVFDNEEVGSRSKQGADSTFLTDVLFRAAKSIGCSEEETRRMLAMSFMVSADNAHAVHPNHPEKYDAENRAFMNEGVVIKHNASQKYTSDGVSTAIFSEICNSAGVSVQTFSNRSDLAGGSTLGNISNSHVSMNTVDIGLAQLAMHSCYETAGTQDLQSMVRALRRFYETSIIMHEDGVYQINQR